VKRYNAIEERDLVQAVMKVPKYPRRARPEHLTQGGEPVGLQVIEMWPRSVVQLDRAAFLTRYAACVGLAGVLANRDASRLALRARRASR
jgi:hypothetical protein